MFGIESKKDKRIKELERMLSSTYYRVPKVIAQDKNVITLCTRTILEDGMPTEYAKEIIARRMVDEIKQYIYYDIDDESCHHALKGYLKIVEVDKNYD